GIGYPGESQTNSGTKVFKEFKAGAEPIALWKAFYHHVGKFYKMVTPNYLAIKGDFQLKHEAYFTLPKIPGEMVAKLNAFFREVDRQQHTEAIVVLTYDFDYKGSEDADQGWGFAVPAQKNNSVHCNYDKSEVESSLDENTFVVGTVHSHPDMPAYASDTDHNDQAGFDGLHITFGWQAKNGKVTEYHSELVSNQDFYWVEPADVMDLTEETLYEVEIDGKTYRFPLPQVKTVVNDYGIDEKEIEKLTEVVESDYSHWNSGPNHTPSVHNQGGGNPKALSPGQDNGTFKFIPSATPKGIVELGADFPDPRKNNIFYEIGKDNPLKFCPACDIGWGVWAPEVLRRRQCLACGVFFVTEYTGIMTSEDERIKNGYTPFANFLDMNIPFVKVFKENHKIKWNVIPVKVVDGRLTVGGDTPKEVKSS
ncbi:MAG: Mov34/MPN/PAD-1 family protein, partial [bacterium]